MDLDEAIKNLDDDQLIDYILEMKSEGGVSGQPGADGKMAVWKHAMLLLGELRKLKLLDSSERDRLRGWLVMDDYDAALNLLESKMEGTPSGKNNVLMDQLAEDIHKLWQNHG